ncbi:Bug family tripartite tricarboxylate transporter substrate binding protein [Cupriavidus gilardii]
MFKTLVATMALAVGAATLVGAARAEAPYPSKPIRLVVPFAPGGSSDILARLLADRLKSELGQVVVVENKPGAGGNIAGESVARAAPDGHTLLLAAAGPTVINPSLYSKMPFDPARDLAPITVLAREHNLMAVKAQLPVRNLSEFLAYARSHPGKLSFGSPGNGTVAHLGGELLNRTAGLKMQHVPYKGSGPAVADLMAGHIDLMIDNMPALLAQVQGGKLRPIAVASDKRAAALPDVPTFDEAGVKGYLVTAWKGLMAPAGTPKPVIAKLHEACARILATPEMRKRVIELGAEPVGNSPEAFAAQIRSETAWWAAQVKATGTRLD